MARKLSFGRVLRDARHKKHMDITTAAARLRIRTDILQAIEDEDFSRMPPRGYTRNMIGAYARLLGLNGSDITRLYLDEAYAIEVGKARNDNSRSSDGYGRRDHTGEGAARPVRHGPTGRAMYDDRDDRPARTYTTDRVHPTQHGPMPTTQYTNFYAGPQNSGLSSRLPFIIAGIVIIIVIIIILVLVFRPREDATQELPNVPIAGVTDTSDAQTTAAPEPVAPTQATFTYEVARGETAYIEIYINGSTVAETAEDVQGPSSRSFDVTDSLRFVTTNPEAVTIKVDGQTVEPTDENDDGIYIYNVDFAAVLNQWLADHGKGTQAGNAATGGATGAATTGQNAQATQNTTTDANASDTTASDDEETSE